MNKPRFSHVWGLCAAALVFMGLAASPARGGAGAENASPAATVSEPSQDAPDAGTGRVRRLLRCGYYDKAAFEKSLTAARAYPTQGRLLAGVVPHHLLAGDMTASFFAAAARENARRPYDTVVFAAPSHYPTKGWVVTTRSGWQTPYGALEIDQELTRRLEENRVLAPQNDPDNMELDHAVTGLAPYVKYYLPQVKAAAVLLPSRLEVQRSDALADTLLEAAGEGKSILFVCSIDFSHYLLPKEAAVRDEQTRRAVESFDYEAIARFTDDNMDSPRTMNAFLRYAQGRGVKEISFLDHSGADKILGLPLSDPLYRDGITTYFILGAEDTAQSPVPPPA